MPFYVKSGSEDKMCFSTSSASSNSILFHHKYFVFEKFPEYIKVQMKNLSLDLFGNTLLDFINKSPDGIALESSTLNYYINLTSSSAAKLCAAINPKVAEKGFNNLVNFLIERSKIARALAYCKDTGKNELVLITAKSPHFKAKSNECSDYKSLYLYQLNAKLTLPEQICKLIMLNGNKGIMATEICQILSIRLKPLTKILNSLCPEYIKKIPERAGKLFYYRYHLSNRSLANLPLVEGTMLSDKLSHNDLSQSINMDLSINSDQNTEFYSWLRNNLEQLSSLVGKVKGKINTSQFRGRIAIIIEYLKRQKFATPADFAKTFCKVEGSEKLVDKRTVNRLISHALQHYRHIRQIKFFPSQNALVPINLIYDSNLTTSEGVKKLWSLALKGNTQNNTTSNAESNQLDAPNGSSTNLNNKTLDLPLIEGIVVSEVIGRSQENASFSQKLLVSNGFVIPIMTRLKITHEFLITLGNDLLTEKSILNKMPFRIFLKVIGCGYAIKDQQWVQQHLSVDLEKLPSDIYKLLMFGAVGRVSNTKNRRVATQIVTKLCLLLTELGLVNSVTEPTSNGTVYQFWLVNRVINKSFCHKDLNCFYCNKGSMSMNSLDDLERFWSHLKSFIWHITESHPDDSIESYLAMGNELEQMGEIQLVRNGQRLIPKEALIRKNWKGLFEDATSIDTCGDIEILSQFIDKYLDPLYISGEKPTKYSSANWWEKLACAENLTAHYGQKLNDQLLYKLVSLLWGFDDHDSKSPRILWQKCQQIITKLLQDGRPLKKKPVRQIKNTVFKFTFRSFLVTPIKSINSQLLVDCFSPLAFKELKQLIKYWTLAKIIHKVPSLSQVTSISSDNTLPDDKGDSYTSNATIGTLCKYIIGKNGNIRLFGTVGSMIELQNLWLCQKYSCYESTISRLEMLAAGKGMLLVEDYQQTKIDKRIYSGGLERHYAMIQQPYPQITFVVNQSLSKNQKKEVSKPVIAVAKVSSPIDGFNLLLTPDSTDKLGCDSGVTLLQELAKEVDKHKIITIYDQLISAQESGLSVPLYTDVPKELTLLYLLKLAFRVPDTSWRFVASSFAKNLLNVQSKTIFVRPKYITNDLWLKCGFNISDKYICDVINDFGINAMPLLDKFSPTIFTTLTGAPNFSIFSLVPLRIYSILRNSPGLTLAEINNKLCLLEPCETLDIISSMIQQGLINQLVTNYNGTNTITYLSNVTPNLEPYEQIIEEVIAQNSDGDGI